VIRERVAHLLDDVAAGRVDVATALDRLAVSPTEALPFATIDHHRALRQGYPEVIFGQGKTPEQAVAIAERIRARGDAVLVTRADDAMRDALVRQWPEARVSAVGRTVAVQGDHPVPAGTGPILVVTAGTSDLPVAEECAETAMAMGGEVTRVNDVGIAGIHRILAQQEALMAARVVVVVAGMDGALPGVVGGLVRCPVIAVPTSVGYGASFSGLAALLTMLNSCAAGVTVVNIDNGFGAAVAATRITHA
jgi:pyridinium-3,5-biscarboxylic acid mononucleotide synthase